MQWNQMFARTIKKAFCVLSCVALFPLLLWQYGEIEKDTKNSAGWYWKGLRRSSDHHDKWIVLRSPYNVRIRNSDVALNGNDVSSGDYDVTSGNDDVTKWAELPVWRVVVVGTARPLGCSLPACLHLNPNAPPNLPIFNNPLFSFENSSRRYLGFLYAMSLGARAIYVGYANGSPPALLKNFPTCQGLRATGSGVFNPLSHFTHNTLTSSAVSRIYKHSLNQSCPWIQQFISIEMEGVHPGDTHTISETVSLHPEAPPLNPEAPPLHPEAPPLNLEAPPLNPEAPPLNSEAPPLHPEAPPLHLPPGMFGPLSGDDAVFTYETLWARVPLKGPSRNYLPFWTQRLLWEIGGHIGYLPVFGSASYQGPMKSTDGKSAKAASQLAKILTNWTCPLGIDFFGCILSLSKVMVTHRFWSSDDVMMTSQHLRHIQALSYVQPTRQGSAMTMTECDDSPALDQPANESGGDCDVIFSLAGPAHHVAITSQLCNGVTRATLEALSPRGGLQDVVLIVLFNWPVYTNVKYVEMMHRGPFTNIVYCGDDAKAFLNATKDLPYPLTFVHASVVRGDRGYRCLERVFSMGFTSVSGYLLIGDDTLINTWNLLPLDMSRVWRTEVNITDCSTGTIRQRAGQTRWTWTQDAAAGANLTRILEELRAKIAALPLESAASGELRPLKNYFRNLQSNTGGEGRCEHGVSDVMYVPHRLAAAMAYVLRHMDQRGQVLELTVPMALAGLHGPGEAVLLPGVNLWGAARQTPWRHYHVDRVFLHPVKLSLPQHAAALCRTYLPDLLQRSYIDRSQIT